MAKDMPQKEAPKTPGKPKAGPAPAAGKPAKKKLSLDITDVSEVLERKISP